jgi:ankyrin repeat protein
LEDGFSPLHLACFRGNIELSKILIQYGAELNSKNNFGITMIHVAVQGD